MKVPIPHLPLFLYAVIGSLSLVFAACWHQIETLTFFDRTIGAFIMGDTNIRSRNIYYMLGIAMAFSLFSGLIWTKRAKLFESIRFRSLSTSTVAPTYLLLAIGVANAAFYLNFEESMFGNVVGLLLLLCLMQLVLRRIVGSEMSLATGIWIQVLAYQLSLSTLLLFAEEVQFGIEFVSLYLVSCFALAALYRTSDTSVYWLYPLSWAPLIPILSNEISYFLLRRFDLQVSFFLASFVLVVVFLSVCIVSYWHCSRQGLPLGSETKITYRRYLPAIVLSNVALVEYLAISTYTFYDYYHLAEVILPIHQWIGYGSLPYIDYYPVHGLFDLFPQLLYTMAFGYQGLEMTTWGQGYMLGWLPRMTAAFIFYVFFSRFWGRLPTALIMLFLPTYHLVHPYYVFLLVPAIALYRLSSKPDKIAPWITVWLAILAVGLWRVDFGIAATAGGVVVFFLLIWQQGSVKVARSCIYGAAIVILPAVVIFAIVVLLKSQSPAIVFQKIVQYALIQLPAGTYIEFIHEYDAVALLQLVILPVIGVAATVIAVNRAFFLRLPMGRLERVLIFLAVASLVISFRSLQRHSLAEGVFNPYFFVFIGLSLLCYLPRKRLATLQCLLVAGIGVSVLIVPKSWDIYSKIYYDHGAEKEYLVLAKDYSFPRWDTKPLVNNQRLDDRANKNRVVQFLDQNLEQNQTFYDFTNSQLLYVLVGRQLPNYLFEAVHHTSEYFQHLVIDELDDLRVRGKLPIVLFSHSGRNKPDGVHTVIRSYRVAEYLYQHYKPCVQIDNYDVWTERSPVGEKNCAAHQEYQDKASSEPPARITKKYLNQEFDVGFLPRIWAQADPYCALCQKEIQNFNLVSSPRKSWQLKLSSTRKKKKQASYLVLEIAATEDTRLQFEYGSSTITMNVKASESPLLYVLRPSMLYAWWLDTSDEATISSEQPLALVSAKMLEADKIIEKPEK
jgi:hypothetical protein